MLIFSRRKQNRMGKQRSRKKKNWILIFGVILILAGILVAAFPFLKQAREEAKERWLLESWREGLSVIDLSEDDDAVTDAAKGASDVQAGTLADDETVGDGAATATTASTASDAEVVGVLTIPAIDLEQPILKEATKAHLSVAPCTIEPTDDPSEDGNFAIAGHNSRTYGRHFNRLHELTIGDEIQFETADATYSYIVTELLIVEPDDTTVLLHTAENPEITLVTCDYSTAGETKRFVVKGERK